MIEGFARTPIYDRCERLDPMPPIVSLRGANKKKRLFPNFFTYADKFMIYDKGIAKKIVASESLSPIRKAVGLFSRCGDIICQAYINEMFNGDWYIMMEKCQKFENLMKGFEEYFNDRRQQFMEKTDEIIDRGIENGMIKNRKSRIPQSHGGVANLLKVLTRTMNEQGSSIRTIAKVQYTICTQAGIYIPDEFITDVLVAQDIVPNLYEEDAKRLNEKNKGEKV